LTNHKIIAAAVVAALLAGCSANGTASPPTSVVSNLQADVLQVAVGTANMGQDGGQLGLNVVTTFRQPNGDSAALVDTPTITGPPAFVVPNACGTGCVDAGTNHISGAPQNVNPAVANPVTTFGQTNGIFSYGIAPDNVGTTGAASYNLNLQPFYATVGNLRYIGGPPAYPFFKDGTYPGGTASIASNGSTSSFFNGYTQGFTQFQATPVAGTYTASVVVATSTAGTPAFAANAVLTYLTAPPSLAAPTFVTDGLGGGAGTVTLPVDARVVETMIYVNDLVPVFGGTVTEPSWYTIGPNRGTGVQTFTLTDCLRPCGGAAGTGCQNNPATRTQTILTGTTFRIYAATYDYPAFEASPPGNTQQSPAINGGAATSNQADITTSPFASAVY